MITTQEFPQNNDGILIQTYTECYKMGNQNKSRFAKQQCKFNVSGVLRTAFFIAELSGRHHQSLCANDVVRSTVRTSTT